MDSVFSRDRCLLSAYKVPAPVLGTKYRVDNKTDNSYSSNGAVMMRRGGMMIKAVTDCGECYEGSRNAAVIKGTWRGANSDNCSRKVSTGGNFISEA